MSTARIMVLSDETVPGLWDYYNPDRLKDVDLIISCGDLPSDYLSFIATMFNGDVLYVQGNHDSDYLDNPPGGCINIDKSIYTWRGLKIMGLGGSFRYKPGPFQYSQNEMFRRYVSMWFKLLKAKKIDLLVTHAPAKGINDGPDVPHTGFETFVEILDKYHPKYFIHGHVHMNYGNYPRLSEYKGTMVINAFRTYTFEVELPD